MNLLKTCVAIAAASALLVLAATPASATVHILEITDGTITSTTVGTLPLGAGGPCTNFSTDTDTLTLDETGTGTPTTTAITALSLTTSWTFFSTPFVVVFTKHTGNNTGTISSAGSVAQNISFKIEFWTATGAPTCTSSTKVCTAQMNGTLTGTATAHPLTTSTAVHLAGTAFVTTIFPLACTAPWATVISTTFVLTSLDLHVTT